VWVADRHSCTTGFLFGIAQRKGFFVIRRHAATLRWERESEWTAAGRTDTGTLTEQTIWLVGPGGAGGTRGGGRGRGVGRPPGVGGVGGLPGVGGRGPRGDVGGDRWVVGRSDGRVVGGAGPGCEPAAVSEGHPWAEETDAAPHPIPQGQARRHLAVAQR
jgi:hypothetical protein